MPRLQVIALAGLALALSASTAWGLGEPIPGVDIIVKENPGGKAMVLASSDASGRFSGRVAKAGQYDVSIVCRRAPCGPFTVQMKASNDMLKAGANMTYVLSVEGREPVTLSGMVLPGGPPPR